MKKYRRRVVLTGILMISMLLLAGCGKTKETETDDLQIGLPAYLMTTHPDEPYACAEIFVKGLENEMGGTASISWKIFETAQELQEYVVHREEAGEQAEWTYYQCRLQEDFHALDLYHALGRYDKTANPICAVTCAKGVFYRFSQQLERELIVRDDRIYGLVFGGSASKRMTSDAVQRILNAFVQEPQKWETDHLAGQILDEEDLYWLDHEERKTTLQDPERTFTEMRAVDADWESTNVKTRRFGMLSKAEYEIAFPGKDAGLGISFHYAGRLPETGYETYLADGVCMDEIYVMRVTDLRTGKLIQLADVRLCIDTIDTVSFADRNGDGFPDLRIERPVHCRDSVQDGKNLENAYYILWDPDKGRFHIGIASQAPYKTCIYAPVRELPENVDRSDCCTLTDEQGELYIVKGQDEKMGYIVQPKGVYVQHLYGDVDYMPFKGRPLEVYTNLKANKMGENALTRDWDNFVSEVTQCSERYGGRVYDLDFEKYHLESGSDLYGYTFDFDAYDKIYEIAVFIRLEKVNMLEVIGIREKADNEVLKDVTRYIGADFVDYGGNVFDGYCRRADYIGSDEWDYPELHNMFAWAMDEYYIYAERPDENFAGDRSVFFKEPQIEYAIRSALEELWQLDDEECRHFEGRPLRMSDLSVITELECERTRDMPSVLKIRINQYEQEIEVAEHADICYRDLAHLSGWKILEMNVFDLTDFTFVGELTSLRELTLCAWYEVDNVDFLRNLSALRSLALGSANPEAEYPGPAGFSNITDLSALGNCGQLAYLFLRTPRVTDFSFLENTPDIYTIVLDSAGGVVPDPELLPNAMYKSFY